MSRGEITLIVNPGANRGGSQRRIAEAEAVLRGRAASYRIVRTGSYAEIEPEARRARDAGAPLVVSCGGDGTNRAVASALAETGTPMGILPSGRGNDLARALGIPSDPEGAVDALLSGHTRAIDLGFAAGNWFTTVATLGIDSEVSERVNRIRNRFPPRLLYPVALLGTLVSYRYPHVVLEGDFGRREGRIVAAATANTPCYGGGMRIVPPADPTDGLLHLCLIRSLPKLKLLVLFPSVYAGRHTRFKEVEILSSRRITVRSNETLPLYADGEFLGTTPMDLEVRAKALRVCVPARPGPVNRSDTSSSSAAGCGG